MKILNFPKFKSAFPQNADLKNSHFQKNKMRYKQRSTSAQHNNMAVSRVVVALGTLLLTYLHTSQSYELTLGLLMPSQFLRIADRTIEKVNKEVLRDVNVTAKRRWKEFKCDDIRPIGMLFVLFSWKIRGVNHSLVISGNPYKKSEISYA